MNDEHGKRGDDFTRRCLSLLSENGKAAHETAELVRVLRDHPSAIVVVRFRDRRLLCVQVAAGQILRVFETGPIPRPLPVIDRASPLPTTLDEPLYPRENQTVFEPCAPGSKNIRRLLCFILGERRVQRTFDPMLADLDAEWKDALDAGDRKRARWVIGRGYFWLLFAICWYVVSAIALVLGLFK